MGILGGLVKGIAGGAKGLLGGAGKGLLGGGGGGLGNLLKGGVGKALESVGGLQGVMDMVQQFAGGGGGGAQGAGDAGAAQGAGGAQGAQPGQPGAKKNPLERLAKKFSEAKTPEDVDKIAQQILQKMEKKGKAKPEMKELVQKIAEATKAMLAGPQAQAA